MEFTTKEDSFEGFEASATSTEVGETSKFSQGRTLDELPGAAFAVITLVWILASFAHLVW